jgi:hypothetical protein
VLSSATALAGTLAAALIAAVPAAALSPGPSAASTAPAPWVGAYRVSVLGGFENSSWSLNHAPTGPCDARRTGGGTDDTTFLKGRPITTQLIGLGPGHALSFAPLTLALSYDENRHGSVTVGAPAAAYPLDCPPATGGAGAPSSPSDCGLTRETTSIDVGLDPSDLELRQHYTGVHFISPYVNCPVEGVVPPAFASPLTVQVPVLGPRSVGALASAKAQLTADQPILSPDAFGSTELELQLLFTRLIAVDAMRLPARARASIDPRRVVTVPLRCPAGAACTGTASLAVGVVSVDTADAVTPAPYAIAPYPRPLARVGRSLASGRFTLRPGQSGVDLVLRGGNEARRRLRGRVVDVVVTETSGTQKIVYDAGLVRLR